jgi:hypothetical protein
VATDLKLWLWSFVAVALAYIAGEALLRCVS